MIFKKAKIKVSFAFTLERFIEMLSSHLTLTRYERILYKAFARIDVYPMSYYKTLVKSREADIYSKKSTQEILKADVIPPLCLVLLSILINCTNILYFNL